MEDTGERTLLISVADVRYYLPIGKTLTYKLIRDGQLETQKVGGRRLIKLSSLRRLAGEIEQTPPSRSDR